MELAEGCNAVAGDVDVLVSPGNAALKVRSRSVGTYACCKGRREFLTRTPQVHQYYLNYFVRFVRSGTYQVQLRSHEVFRGDGAKVKDLYRERGDVDALSNTLELTIMPDDPEWDAETLRTTLAAVSDRQLQRAADAAQRQRVTALEANPPARHVPGPLARRYYDAMSALQALDTDEVIRERVRRLPMPTEREWRTKPLQFAGDAGAGASTRPDAVVAAIEARAAEPDFGVSFDFAGTWRFAVALRDNPDLRSPLHDDPKGDPFAEVSAATSSARPVVLDSLKRIVLDKTGLAREMTADTIQRLEREK